MNNKLQYFQYFSKIHIESLIFSIFFAILLITIPKVFKFKNDKHFKIYEKILGIFIIFFKFFDSFFRAVYEFEPIPSVMITHLCNFALIFGGLYLITQSKSLFNIAYFFSFGAFFALLLPGINQYYNWIYIYIFMISHILEFVAVIYGFLYSKVKIQKKGLIKSWILLIIIFTYGAIYNYIFRDLNLNAMFLKEYISPIVSFIKPFWLYRFILIFAILTFMYIMYIPFKNYENKKD